MRRRIKAKELIVLITVGISFILLLLLVISYLQDMNKVKISRMLYQEYTGVRYEYSGDKVLEYNTEKGVSLTKDEEQEYLDSVPLYYDDENRIILTQDMIYTAPNSLALFQSAGFFTEFYYNDYEQSVMFESKESSGKTTRGFLYDGGDVFVFLEPVTVTYEGNKHSLDIFSYIEAIYNYELRIFSYADQKSYIYKLGTDPVYAVSSSGYKIELQNDGLEWDDGRKVILFTEASMLPELEKQ